MQPYRIKRPVMEYYIPLSDRIERQLDEEYFQEREQLRQKFIQRASNPPTQCSEVSAEWYDYVDEMRALEEQLKAAGEVF